MSVSCVKCSDHKECPINCPNCKANDYYEYDDAQTSDTNWRYFQCNGCGYKWWEQYDFSCWGEVDH